MTPEERRRGGGHLYYEMSVEKLFQGPGGSPAQWKEVAFNHNNYNIIPVCNFFQLCLEILDACFISTAAMAIIWQIGPDSNASTTLFLTARLGTIFETGVRQHECDA